MLGSWEINISNNFPQKVASAVSELDNILGAEYKPIAYLGHQEVNGVNHAVLAEQLVVSGKDTKNIVLLIFNEKPSDMKATLVDIERVVESGEKLGGIVVNDNVEMTEEAKNAFDTVVAGFVGSKIEPFAYLGSQMTKGTNYILAATITPVVANPTSKVGILIVNDMTGEMAFTDMLTSKTDVLQLGYAFTWLKAQKTFI